MKILERSIDPISLDFTPDGASLMMTLHGVTPDDDRVPFLSSQEARILAYGLLYYAEKANPQ